MISGVLCHPHKSNFTVNTWSIDKWNHILKTIWSSTCPKGQWVKYNLSCENISMNPTLCFEILSQWKVEFHQWWLEFCNHIPVVNIWSYIHLCKRQMFLLGHYNLLLCNPLSFSPPGQNGCHFADNIFRCVSVKEMFCILIKKSLKFVHKVAIDNNPALV